MRMIRRQVTGVTVHLTTLIMIAVLLLAATCWLRRGVWTVDQLEEAIIREHKLYPEVLQLFAQTESTLVKRFV